MPPHALTPAERTIYRRYAALALPRHTSYPIASVWTTDFHADDFIAAVQETARQAQEWSVYVHIPFCERLCFYCACTKEIVSPGKRRQYDPSDELLNGLEHEATLFSALLAGGRVRQLHLGGGSPTFLDVPHLERLANILRQSFCLHRDAEMAVEIDPRITMYEQLKTLRHLGFNRISLGVQDFDPTVQQAVNRIQPLAQVAQTVAWCRELGFASLNFDLIYGLPYQTLDSMADTLEKTLQLAPDRIAFYRLAVIPEIFRWQHVFRHTDLPSGDLTLDMNLLAINRFQEAGYEFIGLDHFARRDEALSQARRKGTLRRNFQGMTTGQGWPILGLGPSAISQLPGAFAQNLKETAAWKAALSHGPATERGLSLSWEDRIRGDLLQQLYGQGVVRFAPLEARYGFSFPGMFAEELNRLGTLVDDGLVQVDDHAIRLTMPLGRLLVRVVAAVFDPYLPTDAYRAGIAQHAASRVG